MTAGGQQRRGFPRDQGTVLITVLLLVAVMSMVAVALVDDIRFGLRRTESAVQVGQARFYAQGAEDLAETIITLANEAAPGITTPDAPWARQPITLPIEGGTLTARLQDGGTCFNLNSVVRGLGSGGFEADPESGAVYVNLLQALGIDSRQASALTAALVDWIDTDRVPQPFGAEDSVYAGAQPPYRPANRLLLEPSELRAITGYIPEIYAVLRPLVCALPVTSPSPINVNMLTSQDAPLLTMLFGVEELPVSRAQTVISRRPSNGYRSLETFETQEAFQTLDPVVPLADHLSLNTRYYDLTVQVWYREAYVEMVSKLDFSPGQPPEVLARRYGVSE